MDAMDQSDSNQDVDEERSDDSEEEAAESDSQSSEVEDDVASRDKDEEKEISASEAIDGEEDEGEEDKSDSKSSTSSRKAEDVSEDELEDVDSDDTSQIQAVHREGPRSPEPEMARSPEPVDMDSISGSEKLPASPKEAVVTQDSFVSPKTQNEQPPDSLIEEEPVDKLSSDMDKPSIPSSTGTAGIVRESLPVQESSDSLPHLEVLSVSETKSEFARHPDSTPKQQLSQHVDDQEAELDFEEEVSEDRKEDVEGGEDGEKSQDEDDKDRSKEDGENVDDADDDGEVEDDDDLEEGEVKDTVTSARKPLQRPICRFFNKGQCTWGTSCRFIHPGINDKGNYNMFGPTKPLVPSNGPIIGGLLGGPLGPIRGHPGYGGRIPAEVVVPPPPVDDVPPVESAWERGLRHAKENLKKANKRKEMEPDFEEKRFNLTLGAGEPEFEKENDYFSRSPFRKTNDPYQAYGYEEPPDPVERQAQEFWRGGNYENFEVRYLRNDYDNYREKEKENKERSRREKSNRYEHGRNQDRGGREGGWRDNRYAEVQVTSRNRADEWKDPWRRSTSPKRRGRSKSYSSASSGSSYSSGSSRSRSSSFSSHSRSSSGTSYSSRSRSRSRNRPSPHRHRSSAPSSSAPRKKQPPPPPVQKSQAPPPKTSRPPPEKRLTSPLTAPAPLPSLPPEQKKKRPPAPPSEKPPPVEKRPPPARAKRPRSPSLSGSESGSSRSRSSRSSVSRSSSRSSVSSRSSSRSSSVSSASDLERKANGVRKRERLVEQEQEHKLMAHLDPQTKAGGATRGSKDPLKQSGQKPQIKLTLLNKAKPMPEKTGISALSHKDAGTAAKSRPQVTEKETKMAPKLPAPAVILGMSKPAKSAPTLPSKTELKAGPPVKSPATLLTMEPPKVPKPAVPSSGSSRKRSAPSPSPPRGIAVPPVGNKASPSVPSQQPPPPPPPSAPAKKSTLSRREELLKQLKAVEDAIARKRAKLT